MVNPPLDRDAIRQRLQDYARALVGEGPFADRWADHQRLVFDLLAEAHVLLDALDQSRWQDLSTAPKDGTQILLGKSGAVGDVTVGWWSTLRKRWTDGLDEDGFTYSQPTHWMPLPAPPADRKDPG